MFPESFPLWFTRPAWLAALLVLPLVCLSARRALANLSFRQRWLCVALRGLVVAALALALAGPTASGPPRPVYPVFLIDASASVSPESQRAAEEFVRRAAAASPGRDYAQVQFAASTLLIGSGESVSETFGQATDLAAALQRGCSIAPPDTAPHVVLLSDGAPTQGDTWGAVEAARNAGIPVSAVPLASCDPEVYVVSVNVPRAIREGETFEAGVTLYSMRNGEGAVEIAHGPTRLAAQRVKVNQGENCFRLRLSETTPLSDRGNGNLIRPLSRRGNGAGNEDTLVQTLTARISGFPDTLAENNAAATPLAVRPRPRALLVENRPSSSEHLAKALLGGGLAVEVRKVPDIPASLDDLKPFEAVVLVNVPAAVMAPQQMKVLKDYVHQGGGLVTVGGDQAFTPGGYRKTVLEDVLPVESEPSRKAARPGLAMVLVVDRSLSMEEGGAIALARQAMRRAVELIEPEDQLGVLVFDEASRWASPIERVGDKAKVLARIESITAGGRTDMAPAIQKAYLALHEAFAAQKHIIVLTDGISHPADFEALAERIGRDGITLSTVALGKEACRPLLEDMARIGKGRFYACDSPQAVPSIMALETASASRLGIREGPFFPQPALRAEQAPGAGLPTPPKARPKGSTGSEDPRSDARRGQETCAERVCPDPCLLSRVDLRAAPSLLGYDETRPKPDAHVVLTSAGGDPLLAWFRCGKGVSVAFTSDVESRWAAAWLAWPDFGRFWTHVVRSAMRTEPRDATVDRPTRSYPDEFRVRPTDRELLRRIAEATGGAYQPEPESVWDLASPGRLPPAPIHYYLLAAAAVLFVADAAARRLG